MIAMLLAAGRGERLRPLTDDMPKALLELGGRTLIERHLERLAASGVDIAVINLGWLGERIVEHVGSGRRFGLQVVYSPEYEQVLETGGGIRRALPLLADATGEAPFWVLNTDVLTDMSLPDIELPDDAAGHLVLVPTPAWRAAGDFALAGGRLDNRPELTFSGVALYRPSFFAGRAPGRFPLAPMLREAAACGALCGSLYRGSWTDIGTPERLQKAGRAVE